MLSPLYHRLVVKGKITHEAFGLRQERTIMLRLAISKVIGVLALSLCFGAAANAGWTPIAKSGEVVLSSATVVTNATTPVAAPEIDPAGALSGLTLLLGGLAIVRGRRSK